MLNPLITDDFSEIIKSKANGPEKCAFGISSFAHSDNSAPSTELNTEGMIDSVALRNAIFGNSTPSDLSNFTTDLVASFLVSISGLTFTAASEMTIGVPPLGWLIANKCTNLAPILNPESRLSAAFMNTSVCN